MVTYDHPFAWIIHAHMLWYDITGSCLVSGKPGLGGFSEWTSRGRVPGGACDGSGHASRAQTALCVNWDTSQGEGRMGWGWGQPREGGNWRKFRPLLQTQRLYKYEGPPHPPSTVGMAARKGRSVMKWGETVRLGERKQEASTWASTALTQGRERITDCCQNKCMFPWIMVHLGLQVFSVVWSADPLFPVKQEEPNEWRWKFKVTHSWQLLRWVNAGGIQAQQCVCRVRRA